MIKIEEKAIMSKKSTFIAFLQFFVLFRENNKNHKISKNTIL